MSESVKFCEYCTRLNTGFCDGCNGRNLFKPDPEMVELVNKIAESIK